MLPAEVDSVSEGPLVRSGLTSGIAPEKEPVDSTFSEQIEERKDSSESQGFSDPQCKPRNHSQWYSMEPIVNRSLKEFEVSIVENG